MSARLLTLQTATPAGSIALTEGERLLGEITLNVGITQTEWLMKAIDQLFAHAHVAVGDLDGIGIVTGPGAFTGLRVGLATAKGLAMATGQPLLTVSSLQTLAMQVPCCRLPVCVMLDARKKEVYCSRYSWEHGHLNPLDEARVSAPDKLLQEIGEETLFVGDGALVYRTLIVRQLAERAHFAPQYASVPRASAAARLALAEWDAGRRLRPEQVTPFYIRPSEAELNYGKA